MIVMRSARCLNDRLVGAVRATGARDMRPAFGFVIRAVDAEEPTVGRLAELLSVTRQAASKHADEMLRRGYLLRAAELRADAGDRAVDGLRRSLLAFVEREGALDEVRALRSRAVL
jgi:hypothetical protein